MESLNVSNQVLGFVFNRLRMQEGKPIGRLTSIMEDSLIFKILINARYKQEHEIVLSNLERTVREETGANIRMYVAQKYEQAKKDSKMLEVPFAELSNKTIGDIERLYKKQINKTVLCNKTA